MKPDLPRDYLSYMIFCSTLSILVWYYIYNLPEDTDYKLVTRFFWQFLDLKFIANYQTNKQAFHFYV